MAEKASIFHFLFLTPCRAAIKRAMPPQSRDTTSPITIQELQQIPHSRNTCCSSDSRVTSKLPLVSIQVRNWYLRHRQPANRQRADLVIARAHKSFGCPRPLLRRASPGASFTSSRSCAASSISHRPTFRLLDLRPILPRLAPEAAWRILAFFSGCFHSHILFLFFTQLS